MIEKAVKTEAKVAFQPTFYIWEIDYRIQQCNCPAHIIATKVQTQGTAIKNSKIKKLKKAEKPKPAIDSSSNIKTSKKTWKQSKKKFWKEKCKQKNPTSGIPVIRGNTASNNIEPKGAKKDLFGITCYNCNKKSYYA